MPIRARSSAAEHAAHNRLVAGSNPAGPTSNKSLKVIFLFLIHRKISNSLFSFKQVAEGVGQTSHEDDGSAGGEVEVEGEQQTAQSKEQTEGRGEQHHALHIMHEEAGDGSRHAEQRDDHDEPHHAHGHDHGQADPSFSAEQDSGKN